MKKLPTDYMGLKSGDVFTLQTWNSLVELVLTLSMRIALLEREVDELKR